MGNVVYYMEGNEWLLTLRSDDRKWCHDFLSVSPVCVCVQSQVNSAAADQEYWSGLNSLTPLLMDPEVCRLSGCQLRVFLLFCPPPVRLYRCVWAPCPDLLRGQRSEPQQVFSEQTWGQSSALIHLLRSSSTVNVDCRKSTKLTKKKLTDWPWTCDRSCHL